MSLFRISNPSELILKIENQKLIWTRHGRIAQITINSKPPEKDSFVTLQIQNEPYIYRVLTRYSYTLSELRNIDFSEEIPGIMYYTVIQDLGDYWEYSALSDLDREGYNNIGLSLYNNNYSIKWQNAFLVIPPGPQIQNVACVSGNANNTISWDLVPGASSYTIYWNTVAGVTNSMKKIENITGNSFVHTGLTNGTRYYYKVVIGTPIPKTQHPLSAEVNGMPLAPPVTAGTLLCDNTDDATNNLSWTVPTTPPNFFANGGYYTIYVSDAPFSTKTEAGVIVLDTNIVTNSYAHTPGIPGSYYYRIEATNVGGSSPLSNSVSGNVI